MVRVIFGIIAIIVLVVGIALVFGGAIFYPEKKYTGNEGVMNHKRTKLKFIGYVVCMVAFLIGLIMGAI